MIFEIGEQLTEEYIALRPIRATLIGATEYDGEWDDMSPEGHERFADLATRYTKKVSNLVSSDDPWVRHGARVIDGDLQLILNKYRNDDHLDDLGHVGTPFQDIRETFDLMSRETLEGWHNIFRRLQNLNAPLDGYQKTLALGLERGRGAAVRQVNAVIEQARALAGDTSPFQQLEQELSTSGFSSLAEELDNAIREAKKACTGFADYLELSYRPHAREDDQTGRERYERAVLWNLGSNPDLDEIYSWGWDEIVRVRRRLEETTRLLSEADSVDEVINNLEEAPVAKSQAEFADFVRQRQELAIAALDRVHFDVPPPARSVTVNLAPPGVPLGAWYYSPSEDFTRPGAIWYSLGQRQVIPLFDQVTTAYHEGFPGHHLQIATALSLADKCTRYHRAIVWYSGYGEGWGLYAERLMEELGFFEEPEYVIGLLMSQTFRACRVVIDIGLHLGWSIPDSAPFFPGRSWDYQTAVDVMSNWARQPADMAVSEVLRYLGLPAQAIAYKVGERAILDLRTRADLELKDFHRRVLGNGEVRLDYLEELVLGEPWPADV